MIAARSAALPPAVSGSALCSASAATRLAPGSGGSDAGTTNTCGTAAKTPRGPRARAVGSSTIATRGVHSATAVGSRSLRGPPGSGTATPPACIAPR